MHPRPRCRRRASARHQTPAAYCRRSHSVSALAPVPPPLTTIRSYQLLVTTRDALRNPWTDLSPVPKLVVTGRWADAAQLTETVLSGVTGVTSNGTTVQGVDIPLAVVRATLCPIPALSRERNC